MNDKLYCFFCKRIILINAVYFKDQWADPYYDTMKMTAMLEEKKPAEKFVYLDRPFVYAIIDRETGIPLFIGAVKDM